MAQDIEVKIKVDTSQAVSGVNKLETGLKGATTQSTALSNSMQGSKQSEFINKLGDGVSKLNPAFGAAIKGANGLILKMWEMAANPVGAVLAGIVVTAKFLYEAFQSSIAGGKELKAIFAGISAVGTQVKDAIFGLGRALINATSAAYKFITLDFKGAAEDMKKANKEATESYKQLGNAVDGTTAKIIYNLTKQQQANDKARKIQDLTQAKTNLLLVQSREILADETASIKDKKLALEAVTKAEIASSKEKERIALKDLQIAKVKAKALGGEEEKKMKAELRQLEIEYTNAQTENAQTGFKLNKQKKMLGRQEVADAKEKNDAIAALNKEVADKRKEQLKIEEDERKRIAKEEAEALKAFQDDVLKNQQQMNVDKVNSEIQESLDEKERKRQSLEDISAMVDALDAEDLIKAKANSDAKILLAQKEAEAKQALFAKTSETLIKGADLLGKNTAAGKSMAVAAALINTYQGITAELATKTVTPFEIGLKIANVGIIAATGFKAVKNILAVKTPGGGGSGGGGSMGSISTPATVAPNVNVVGASRTNAIAETIAQQGQQPIKAYVVANDVTTQQGLNRSIVTSASIG
jgi:hypothetical protein